MKTLFYIETEFGCGIRLGEDEDEIYEKEKKSIGTEHDITLVREATERDISWVKTMGGYIPLLTK